MPEVRNNNDPIPFLTRQQLSNKVDMLPWICNWPGSSGSATVLDESDFAKLILGYKEGCEEQAKKNIKLRLSTEGGIPEDQIVFQKLPKLKF